MAKLIIKLINSVAEVVNNDPEVKDRLKVVFFPGFQREKRPARLPRGRPLGANLHRRQGGLRHRQYEVRHERRPHHRDLDGANVEIREEVGPENFFLFGLTAEEVADLKAGNYNPLEYYERDRELREVLDLISSGYFSHGDTQLFQPVVASLLYRDEYLLLADYRALRGQAG
jgi:glycogen phosphorylase